MVSAPPRSKRPAQPPPGRPRPAPPPAPPASPADPGPTDEQAYGWMRDDVEAAVAKPPEPPKPPRFPPGLIPLAWGLAALLVAFLALPYAAALPSGILLLDVALAYGLLGLLRLLFTWRKAPLDDAFLAALVPLLALPTLTLFLAAANHAAVPLGWRYTIASSVLLLALGSLALLARPVADARSFRRRCALLGSLFLALVALCFAALLASLPGITAGQWATLALTLGVVAAALGAQRLLRRAANPRWQVLGTPLALALAATQLLDGTVSYLAVRNPLGLLAHPAQEQMALSAFLLEWTGPAYILAKWALALLVVKALDKAPGRGRIEDPYHRAIVYLAIAYVGMGPAIYSTSRLFF